MRCQQGEGDFYRVNPLEDAFYQLFKQGLFFFEEALPDVDHVINAERLTHTRGGAGEAFYRLLLSDDWWDTCFLFADSSSHWKWRGVLIFECSLFFILLPFSFIFLFFFKSILIFPYGNLLL